jgi:hypothetical protein
MKDNDCAFYGHSFPAGPMNFPNQETGSRRQEASKGMLIIEREI